MAGQLTNWARNITFGARQSYRPTSVAELQRLVAGSDRLRPLGTGHSFNRIADTTGDQVSVADLPATLAVDTAHSTVTVAGGIRYSELAARLNKLGYALHNLGSLPHISVAGACATGTHGSGVTNGNLATAVSAMEFVTAEGDLVTRSRAADGDEFAGLVVGLGGFGVVTSLTLDIEPTFDVRQYVYEGLPVSELAEHFQDIVTSEYSVSLFTDWRTDRINQVWLKRRATASTPAGAPEHWYGATPATGPRNPVPGMPADNATQQQGVPGPWHERLPHFRPEFTPSSGEELQSEYLLGREQATQAFAALAELSDRIAPLLQICEIRTIAADHLWLSPSYRRDTVAFHFTWVQDTAAVTEVLGEIEQRLAPFGARPHWGKVFTTSAATVRGLYERLPDFERLLAGYDPAGKFRNALLDQYFPAE
jgi:xylitol oxidase